MTTKKHSLIIWRNVLLGSALLYSSSAQAEEFIPQAGFGIFYNFGTSSDWGIEVYGNVYPIGLSEMITVPTYMGGNLQVNFKKEEKPTFVYSFQTGLDFLLAKSGIELGLAQQDGKRAFQYGVHIHGLIPTVSWRSAKELNKSYVGIGVRGDILPFGFMFSQGVDGRPLRIQEGFASQSNAFLIANHTPQQQENPWLTAAYAEWASINAFADLVQQLVCCNAPKRLIKRAKKAMDDEFRHTVLCAGIASKIFGNSVHLPQINENRRIPLPGKEGLSRLALESWFDGCLNEGIAAERLKYRAQDEQDEDALSALIEIIYDELEHAELAWDILDWCIQMGDKDIQETLLAAKETVPNFLEKEWEYEFFYSAQMRLTELLS